MTVTLTYNPSNWIVLLGLIGLVENVKRHILNGVAKVNKAGILDEIRFRKAGSCSAIAHHSIKEKKCSKRIIHKLISD